MWYKTNIKVDVSTVWINILKSSKEKWKFINKKSGYYKVSVWYVWFCDSQFLTWLQKEIFVNLEFNRGELQFKLSFFSEGLKNTLILAQSEVLHFRFDEYDLPLYICWKRVLLVVYRNGEIVFFSNILFQISILNYCKIHLCPLILRK